MSPPIALALLVVFVLLTCVRAMLRRMTRHERSANVAGADIPAKAKDLRVPPSRICPACGGSGFVTRMQPVTETRTEMQTEFYTDYAGRSATRTIARPKTTTFMKTVRVPCGFCGGSGWNRT